MIKLYNDDKKSLNRFEVGQCWYWQREPDELHGCPRPYWLHRTACTACYISIQSVHQRSLSRRGGPLTSWPLGGEPAEREGGSPVARGAWSSGHQCHSNDKRGNVFVTTQDGGVNLMDYSLDVFMLTQILNILQRIFKLLTVYSNVFDYIDF